MIIVSGLPKAKCCGGTTLQIIDNGDSFGGECANCKLFCTNSHRTPGEVLDEWLYTPGHYLERSMEKEIRKSRREYRRRYDAENREHIKQYQRQWRKENPDKVRAIQERYWAKKASRNDE